MSRGLHFSLPQFPHQPNGDPEASAQSFCRRESCAGDSPTQSLAPTSGSINLSCHQPLDHLIYSDSLPVLFPHQTELRGQEATSIQLRVQLPSLSYSGLSPGKVGALQWLGGKGHGWGTGSHSLWMPGHSGFSSADTPSTLVLLGSREAAREDVSYALAPRTPQASHIMQLLALLNTDVGLHVIFTIYCIYCELTGLGLPLAASNWLRVRGEAGRGVPTPCRGSPLQLVQVWRRPDRFLSDDAPCMCASLPGFPCLLH